MNKPQSKKGQTLIEFALVSVLFIIMILVTLNVSLAFVIQQYFSYATFMSARAYQSSRDTPENQKIRACDTLERFIPGVSPCAGSADIDVVFSGFSKPLTKVVNAYVPTPQNFKYGSGGVAEEEGNYIGLDFRVNLLNTPLFHLGGNLTSVTLKARSFLGREVSTTECRTFFQNFLQTFWRGTSSSGQNDVALDMEDSGC